MLHFALLNDCKGLNLDMTPRLSAVVVASLVLLPFPLSAWAQGAAPEANGAVYRNDIGHSGYTPDTLPTPMTLLWRHTTVAAPGSTASPASAGGLVYFGSGPRVYALNAADGSLAWQFPASEDATDKFASTPTLADGFLYIGCDNSQVYKLDAKTGKQVWAKKVGGAVRSSPVVDGGLVYFGCADQNGYALSTDTGQTAWSSPTQGSITASPTVFNGQALFASSDNSLYSFNATSGKREWSERLPSDPSASPPIFGGSSLYVGSGDTLYALQERGGRVRWSQRLSGELSTPPTYGGGSVYVATEDRAVYAFNDRGRLRWSKSLDYPSNAAPLLAGSVLLIPTQHGILYALDAQTGALKWEYVVQPAGTATQPKTSYTDVDSAPVWAGKTLYVLSDDGTLSAFRSGAVDKVAPQATNLLPSPGSVIPGNRIPYGATLVDMGSGINPASVSLQVDQTPIALAKYDPSKNGVVIDLSQDTRGDVNRSLGDGAHQVTLKAQDWRGNALAKTWAFVVDNRLNPPSTPNPGGTVDLTPNNPASPETAPPLPQPPGSTNAGPAIPRGANGRDPDGGVNGGPPPPPPIDVPIGPNPPTPRPPTPAPPTPPGPTPPPPTPPGGGAPPPPSPPT